MLTRRGTFNENLSNLEKLFPITNSKSFPNLDAAYLLLFDKLKNISVGRTAATPNASFLIVGVVKMHCASRTGDSKSNLNFDCSADNYEVSGN